MTLIKQWRKILLYLESKHHSKKAQTGLAANS